MRILLTGGSGFIGQNIVRQLASRYTILAPSHSELELGDTQAVVAYLKKNPVDVVIHAANRGGTRKVKDQSGVAVENLRVFFNLLEAKPYYNRLIMLGSGAEYDKSRPLVQVAETSFGERIPTDEYGLYKYTAAKFAEQVDFITHLRLFAVFGAGEDPEIRFISNAICKALLGLPITIKQNVRFDYLSINDCVQIIEACVAKKPTEKFLNVASGAPVDLITIAQKIVELTSANVPVIVATEGLGNEYSADVSRLKKTIENARVTPLEEALLELIAHYRAILPTLDKQRFIIDP
jgi:GDP-L-fucose synthase